MEITFVRHAETVANAAGVLEGQDSSALSESGRVQTVAVATRLNGRPFDLCVASDLLRALETAEALDHDFEPAPDWRELNIGAWEGMTWAEVQVAFADELDRMRAGDDVRFGGGESLEEFSDRVVGAFRELTGRLEDGQRALVVTHGGVINEVVKHVAGLPVRTRRFGRSENTSLTVIRRWHGDLALARFNDGTHLEPMGGYARERMEAGDRVVSLVRHGQTDANLESRWQGSRDSGLNDIGRRQADALAAWFRPEAVFTSPLGRARSTAERLGAKEIVEDARLAEMRMGDWEDLTTDEIKKRWPEMWNRIFVGGEDMPRGGTGETWAVVGERVEAAVAEAVAKTDYRHLAVVTHGAAIRAYLGRLLGLSHAQRHGFVTVDNTSVTSLIYEEHGPVLGGFNLVPHLEGA
jgi:broad specificity phosphatase PhoE